MPRSQLAEDLVEIYQEALGVAHAGRAVEGRLQVSSGAIRAGRRAIALDRVESVGVVAIGKAAPAMAEAVPDAIKNKMSFGIIVTKEGYSRPVDSFEVREAGHPIPDRRSIRATDEVVELVGDGAELGVVGGLAIMLPLRRLTFRFNGAGGGIALRFILRGHQIQTLAAFIVNWPDRVVVKKTLPILDATTNLLGVRWRFRPPRIIANDFWHQVLLFPNRRNVPTSMSLSE